ncbi:MAG: patatin-like protein [Chthoniobacterales bacterium]
MTINPEREVRFAVVMYGGVSLAIYINGVAQELLNMVRATAPKTAGGSEPLLPLEALTSSEAVYRKLALHLDEKRGSADPTILRTRFIVDVISGTSAGGINGVFLAKALARNQKMDGLKTLWLQEGDLGKLLNDSESVSDLSESGFKVRRPEQSLLNSQRMYRKLLEALDQMSANKADSTEDSPLVGELDLFITTTDIEGIPLPITLADSVVYERRYKNVFHFRYAPAQPPNEPRDDFKMENDPFLAFAARCTSSFPFAFQPMCWGDVEEITSSYPRYAKTDLASKQWDTFFTEYLRPSFYDIDKDARGEEMQGTAPQAATEKLRRAFRSRAFGDGGYLDNKPFSYATAMLMRRHSDCVVDRKLVYVEPSPEHPELMPHQPEPPDFAENVQAAVLELPRQETIREDIDRLYERNAMLERLASFAKNVDQDIECIPDAEGKKARTRGQFVDADLRELIGLYGISYGAYHRLRVDETTALIATLVARAAGHDPSSDAVIAIRELVAAWRLDNYTAIKEKGKPNQKTENLFLIEFDIQYRLRRLFFLERQIAALAHLGEKGDDGDRARTLFEHVIQNWKNQELFGGSQEQLQAFRNGLAAIKKEVGNKLKIARFAQENLLKRDPSLASIKPGAPGANSYREHKLSELISELQLSWEEMKGILVVDPAGRLDKARVILSPNTPSSNRPRHDILQNLADVISAALMENVAGSPIIYDSTSTDVTNPGVAARVCLEHYYGSFAHYDLVTYPIEYGSGASEANVVDVFRVSPEDATSLIDERAVGNKRQKLAGRTLMSFGAFLDERWRKNDMLWGRLDGAERLITAVLPVTGSEADLQYRDGLIKEAHKAILSEVINQNDVQAVSRILSRALASYQPGSEEERKLRGMIKSFKKTDLSEAMQSALQKCLDGPEELWQYYKSGFEVNRELDAEQALRLISRATAIIGNMLEGLADKYRFGPGKRVAGWIARLGTWFWSLVTVAVPQSLPNLFFRHWIAVLYVFDLLLILGGTFLAPSVKTLGWEALGITIIVNIAVSGVGHYITSRSGWMRLLRSLLGVVLIVLIVCGAVFLNDHIFHLSQLGEYILVSLLAGSAAVVIAYVEWWRWVKAFLARPNPRPNYVALALLTGTTLFLAGVLAWLGPPSIAGLEFSRTREVALDFIATAKTTTYLLRRQLAVDYLFIIAYAATFASYCVAGARLFWQGRLILVESIVAQSVKRAASNQAIAAGQGTPGKNQEKSVDESSFWLRALLVFAVTGFAVAALQWIAAIADAAENTGLLSFLSNQSEPMGLEVAYWAATVKFALIGLGALYSLTAFIFAICNILRAPEVEGTEEPGRRKRHRARAVLLATLAFVALLTLIGCARNLWRCPSCPENCFPKLETKNAP